MPRLKREGNTAIKREELPWVIHEQLMFYHNLAECNCIPGNVKLLGEYSYRYDWVEGTSPAIHIKDVYKTAVEYLWGDGTESPLLSHKDRINYVDYACHRLTEAVGSTPIVRRLENCMVRFMVNGRLTPAHIVHGDMTLENMVERPDGSIVFIDPGVTHGLNCRELDEAKLCQSILGHWESIKHDTPRMYNLTCLPFVHRPEHLALEASHWARLLAHPELHDGQVMVAGLQRLEVLLEEMTLQIPRLSIKGSKRGRRKSN